jgi:DNA polymerase-3 subunit delta'
MNYDEQSFKEEQPVLSELFVRARSKKRLSHAYLLYGEPSSPVLESAMFMAESLNCEKSLLACRECPSCKRFEEGIHPDFLFIDGSKGLIKKSDVDEISDFFSLSALEKDHLSIYLINHIENITEEAINALLKTLEEPSGNTIALLTTTNRDKVIPTILSRCDVVPVRSPDVGKIMEEYHGEYAKEMYYLVASLAYSESDRKTILDSDEFSSAYKAAYDYLYALAFKSEEASYKLMREAGDNLKGNKCYNYFYTVLSIIFTDVLTSSKATPYKDICLGLEKYSDRLSKAISLCDKLISQSQANMNFTFSLARLGKIMEG